MGWLFVHVDSLFILKLILDGIGADIFDSGDHFVLFEDNFVGIILVSEELSNDWNSSSSLVLFGEIEEGGGHCWDYQNGGVVGITSVEKIEEEASEDCCEDLVSEDVGIGEL